MQPNSTIHEYLIAAWRQQLYAEAARARLAATARAERHTPRRSWLAFGRLGTWRPWRRRAAAVPPVPISPD